MTFDSKKAHRGWSIESSRNTPHPDLERLRAQQVTRFSLDSLDPQTKLRTGNKSHSSSEVLSFLGGSVDRDVQAGYTRLFFRLPFHSGCLQQLVTKFDCTPDHELSDVAVRD